MLGFPSDLFPSGFPIKILCTFLISPLNATRRMKASETLTFLTLKECDNNTGLNKSYLSSQRWSKGKGKGKIIPVLN
jgi:hypothetical protein